MPNTDDAQQKQQASEPQATARLASPAENVIMLKSLLGDCRTLLAGTKGYRKVIRRLTRDDTSPVPPGVALDKIVEDACDAFGELVEVLETLDDSLEEVRRRTLAIIDELEEVP
ncbi:MAG TPA: hypothetical protein VN442_17205 [Bryobacteraceae bacterium]|nr:hypothetical protein [Bryobacteraceae bacterium]HWR35823.1 hypothetical protein [Clostridia bacterium]